VILINKLLVCGLRGFCWLQVGYVKMRGGGKKLVTSLSDIQSRDNQFCRDIDRQLISEEETLLWLSKRDLKRKTGS